MSEKARVIRECIEHLKGQPGRNAIRSLKRMLAEYESCQKAENNKRPKPEII